MLGDTLNDNFFSGQGEVLLALRDSNGNPGAFWRVGNAPQFEIGLTIERTKHKESRSGQRLEDKVQAKTKGGTVKMVLEDIRKDNLALLLSGQKVTLASGSYTSGSPDTFPSGLAVGSIVKLTRPNASSIVIKDSAGSPATLTLNTHYKVLDADHGLIEILSLASLTQPFKAEYSYAATDIITVFEASDDNEYFLYLASINTEANPDQKIGAEVYRIVFDPVKLLALINEEQGTFELEGTILRDADRADDSNHGGFARWMYVDANV
jgi:hypothetical protein